MGDPYWDDTWEKGRRIEREQHACEQAALKLLIYYRQGRVTVDDLCRSADQLIADAATLAERREEYNNRHYL